jgi:hypothetical protein
MTVTFELFVLALTILISVISWVVKTTLDNKKEVSALQLKNADEHNILALAAQKENNNIQTNYKARLKELEDSVNAKVEEVRVESEEQFGELRQSLEHSFAIQSQNLFDRLDSAFKAVNDINVIILKKIETIEADTKDFHAKYLPALDIAKAISDEKSRQIAADQIERRRKIS